LDGQLATSTFLHFFLLGLVFKFTPTHTYQHYLLTTLQTLIKDNDWPTGKSGVDFFFIEEDGATFKATVLYEPYFLIVCKPGTDNEVDEFLRRKFERLIVRIDKLEKEDLKQVCIR
jgi:DNA polymerase epsilon subunit 1